MYKHLFVPMILQKIYHAIGESQAKEQSCKHKMEVLGAHDKGMCENGLASTKHKMC